MELTIRPDGILQIDNAWITYRNFSGVGDQFNREGDRHFTLVIEDERIAEALVAEGWNVRVKPARVEGDNPRWHLKVKVKFTEWGPHVYLVTNGRKHKLDEESVHRLDKVRIGTVRMDVRPYDWTMATGKSGRTAYLQAIEVHQRIDDRFGMDGYPSEDECDGYLTKPSFGELCHINKLNSMVRKDDELPM